MARLDPLPMEQLTPEQKALHAALIGTRKQLSGPFGVWLRNPAIADAADRLVKALRENGKLEWLRDHQRSPWSSMAALHDPATR